MERRPVIVAAAVLALLAALVVAAVNWGEQPDPAAAPEAANTHTVVVRTVLTGPPVYYFEGALVEVELVPAAAADPASSRARATGAMPVGESVTWTDVPPGSFELTGAVLPCSGSCDHLDPPTDSCRLDLDLTADTEAVVVFRWARPCEVRTLAADETVVPRLTDRTSVAQARSTLEGQGLVVELTSALCPEHALAAKFVLDATPRPGAVVATGSVVTLERCLFP